MSTPLYIVTGFLGSGKTTFLRRILDRYAADKKIGIIQNEFAALNVDAVELKRSGHSFELLEINRGSVFCVCLVADFKTGLRDFVDRIQPDAVFLEASGLSDPVAVVEILQAAELANRVFLARIWSVVDASTFLQMEKVNLRMSHQVRVADVVIVNRGDKAEAEAKAEVEERVRQINPLAEVVVTSYCDVDIDIFAQTVKPNALLEESALATFEPQGRPDMGTAVIKSTKTISRLALEQFLREQVPKSYRLKGHVELEEGTMMVQAVLGETTLTPMDGYVGPSEIVAIGPGINAREFSKRFRELA